MTPPPTFQVSRDQAGTYALTLVWPNACHVVVHYATLEQIELAAAEILHEVHAQRALEGDA